MAQCHVSRLYLKAGATVWWNRQWEWNICPSSPLETDWKGTWTLSFKYILGEEKIQPLDFISLEYLLKKKSLNPSRVLPISSFLACLLVHWSSFDAGSQHKARRAGVWTILIIAVHFLSNRAAVCHTQIHWHTHTHILTHSLHTHVFMLVLETG